MDAGESAPSVTGREHPHHLRSALHHVVDALDAFDREMESLREDVRDGVHDALLDPEAMTYAMSFADGGGPNLARSRDAPDDAP